MSDKQMKESRAAIMCESVKYDVALAKVDVDSPLGQQLSPKVFELMDQLDAELRTAYNKYANAVVELRGQQAEVDAHNVVDNLAYENALISVGSLFAELLLDGASPAYAMAFFTRTLGAVAEYRAEREVRAKMRKVGEFFENIATQAAAAKNPNN